MARAGAGAGAGAQAVLAALAVCLASADEYGGGRMPQYDGAEDAALAALQAGGDYRGHSPDAPAPLDYKYEDDSQGNTEKFTKVVDSKLWKKPARKQRGLRHERDESEDVDAAAEPFVISEPRRRRTRGPSDGGGGVGGHSRGRRRRRRRGRARDDDAQPVDFLNADYRVVKNDMLRDDVYSFTSGEPTEVIIQRKPRARFFDNKHVKPLKSDDSYMEQDLISDRRLKGDQSMEADDMEYEERRRVRELGARRLVPSPPDADGDASDDADDGGARLHAKQYRDYNYYDSKKLPMLVRRTTTRVRAPTTPTIPSASADLLAQLWTARRAYPPAETATPPPPPPPPPPPRTDDTDTDPSDPTKTTTPTSSGNISSEFTSELSIAEKSRLSILKKSQKKEHDKGDPSKKPPVLLQVTSKLATVVMVEPATRAEPWLRARRVSGDSPRQLDQVKRLMRHKLVAGAKSIQELTDNWDDMVCDYIDVSLLEARAARPPQPAGLTLAIVFLLIHLP